MALSSEYKEVNADSILLKFNIKLALLFWADKHKALPETFSCEEFHPKTWLNHSYKDEMRQKGSYHLQKESEKRKERENKWQGGSKGIEKNEKLGEKKGVR